MRKMETREIKFRAWHIGEEKMCNVELLRPGIGAFLSDLIPEPDQIIPAFRMIVQGVESGRFCDPAEYHIMQYTGLKDKNGKEIYEGDVVSAWSEGYKHTGEIRWRLEGQPSIIIYPAFANQGFWKIHGTKNSNGTYTDDGVEVIGNLYENPELLTTNNPAA